MPDSNVSRRGVVIIIAVLLLIPAILPPAIQWSREVAGSRRCKSNLQRIGIALHSYHDTFGTLPPAAVWVAGDLDIASVFAHRTGPLIHDNWVQLIFAPNGQ